MALMLEEGQAWLKGILCVIIKEFSYDFDAGLISSRDADSPVAVFSEITVFCLK